MRTRGLAQGMASVFNGLGMGLGGPVGGLVNDWLGWRWAFLIQTPVFLLSLALTFHYHHYVTPGKGKGPKEILKRIDYAGSFTLLISVASALVFLSARYNEGLPWSDPTVIASITIAVVGFICFLLVELLVAQEPVLAPSLLKQKIPILVGTSNFLVATCNFAVNYYYPMWFQTVLSTNASTAGLHLVPNSVAISLGSLFAGYMMHRMGRYKVINLTFGWFPFIGASMVASLRKDSSAFLTWFGIVGACHFEKHMTYAHLAGHLPDPPRIWKRCESQMAVGTGFGQLFRGIGQVGGVAVSAAIFQSRLDTELRQRFTGPDAEEMIMKIRHSSQIVATLPPELQMQARDSYEVSLRTVFTFSAISTLLAFVIPDRSLDEREKAENTSTISTDSATPQETEHIPNQRCEPRTPRRRLSVFESIDGNLDPVREEAAAKASERLHK
ncbi:hypothetical protein H0H93_011051 [Arthromyces matolae]|nr:hypothetical protein H0H93_011051 [Arthromyces matolae]